MSQQQIETGNFAIGRDDAAAEPAVEPAPVGLRRYGPIAVSVLTLVLLLLPVRQNWTEPQTDDFPLSFYPMFTAKRGETTRIYHVVGLTSDGETVNVPGKYAAKGGMNTVRRQMSKMCHDGRAAELAERVAARLDGSPFAEHYGLRRIAVVRSEYAIDPYFEGATEPVSRRMEATLELAAGSAP